MTDIYYLSAGVGVVFGYFSIKRDSDYVVNSIRNAFNSIWGYLISLGGIALSAYDESGLLTTLICIGIFFACRIPGRMICSFLGHSKYSSNYKLAKKYFAGYPRTHKELQSLVATMADIYKIKHSGEKDADSFARQVTLETIELPSCLYELTRATVYEHKIDTDQTIDTLVMHVRKTIYNDLLKFSECYPNWSDSYAYAKIYLTEHQTDADIAIKSALN